MQTLNTVMNKTGSVAATAVLAIAAMATSQDANAIWVTTSPDTILNTDTNQEWKKLTPNYGKSYSEIMAMNDGFQYAGTEAVEDLFHDFGLSTTGTMTSPLDVARARAFQIVFGYYQDPTPGSTYAFSLGITGDFNEAGKLETGIVAFYNAFEAEAGAPASFAYTENDSNPFLGHWRVRDFNRVPEPDSAALFGIAALAGIGVAAARRRREQSPAPKM